MSQVSPDAVDVVSAWREAVLGNLTRGGPVCQRAAQYILENDKVEIGFSRQSTGARWTLKGNIELNVAYYPFKTRTNPSNPQLLGAIVHEAVHLEQGAALALSVEGEVGGWKAEHDARAELNAPIKNIHWKAVALTPDSPTNQELCQARSEMLKMTGYRYLVWLLPLRPNFWTRLVERVQRIVVRVVMGRKGDCA